MRRWIGVGNPPLNVFAPYASYFLEVELFFLLAVNRGLISSERKSNRIDISYLFYLPFCMVFVSTDKLHRKCAPLFLRDNQRFVWGTEFKDALRKTNDHFKTYPKTFKEKGLNAIAPAPPTAFETVVTTLFDTFCQNDWRETLTAVRPLPGGLSGKELLEKIKSKANLPEIPDEELAGMGEATSMTIERRISKGRGSWYQLPKNIDKLEKRRKDADARPGSSESNDTEGDPA